MEQILEAGYELPAVNQVEARTFHTPDTFGEF